jgi:hypothetical protein
MAAAAVIALRIGNTRNAAPLVMVSTEPAAAPGRPAADLVPEDRPAR